MSDDPKPSGEDNGNAAVSVADGSSVSGLNGVVPPVKPAITRTPGVCGGDACIRNTRIPVWSLVATRRLGISDDEFQNYFVTPLTLADVQAACLYYEQHREEIDNDIKENEEA